MSTTLFLGGFFDCLDKKPYLCFEMKESIEKKCLEQGSEYVVSHENMNLIPPPEEESLLLGYLKKFKDPLIIVLLVVFFFSVVVALYGIHEGKPWSTLIEPTGVLVALLLATGVGFLFEVKAAREFKILNKQKNERPVKVLRWKKGADRSKEHPVIFQIAKRDVVKGDVVRLESGDEVPADGILLDSKSLNVDESAFTGEMFAGKKVDVTDDDDDAAYPCNRLLRGSIVIEGYCLYQVDAVGVDTEEGRGAKLMNEETEVVTPLNQQLNTLGLWITKASYVVAAMIVVGRLIYYLFFDGHATDGDWLGMLQFLLDSILLAVTLVVVAVPEGLPMSVTISLALSMRRMLKENNLVRRLHACETMGAATVVCTDKTGTLTKNKLRVMEDSEEVWVDIEFLAQNIAVNSTAELATMDDGAPRSIGNPTEGSLLYWLLRRKGLDYHKYREQSTIIDQVPFTPETKYMVTIATDNVTNRTYRYVKGAPEIILGMCDEIAKDNTEDDVRRRLAEMQNAGRRTLAFACQEIIKGETTPLVFIGFVGMADPVRMDVPDAVKTCQQAGVRVIMVTGDVALTANEIARETGIMSREEPVQDVTGQAFAEMDDNTIKQDVLPRLKVLSRARPADKLRLVSLLQEKGEVVAVTGDGTNDALALKKAQVGLSMGDGTSRAKEASDITIIDNSFASINKAILWGRSLYMNIKRFLLFQMTINVCACLIVLLGAFTGLQSPLNVTQMLWVNLIMDTFAAIALSSLPADKRVMRDKPRSPRSHIIDRKMAKQILWVSMLFFLFLVVLWQLLWHGDINAVSDLFDAEHFKDFFKKVLDWKNRKAELEPKELGVFFTTFVLMQFWNLFNVRYYRTGRSLVSTLVGLCKHQEEAKASVGKGFLFIAMVILLGQVFIVTFAGEMFGVERLGLADWLFLLVITSPILIIGEIGRMVKNRKK